MQAERNIRDAQIAWAKSQGLSIDDKGYVDDVDANLWKPLSARARAAYERGAGSELEGHMKALHASSALVVNFFDYWTDRPKAPLLSALGIDADDIQSLDFEARFSTGLGGTPPHLDVAITFESGAVIGIESKFTEYLSRSTIGKSGFELSYFPPSGGLWASKGLPACQLFAEELRSQQHQFEFLDPWQLLKHALGMARRSGADFSLWYLYYDCPGQRSDAHKREIQTFANRVGEEIRFTALTYQEVYHHLQESDQPDSRISCATYTPDISASAPSLTPRTANSLLPLCPLATPVT